MTSTKQDEAFISKVINPRLLEAAIEWIEENMEPEDIFGSERLIQWATDNDFVKGE